MGKLISLIIACLTVGAAGPAWAGSSGEGKIIRLQVRATDGLHFVVIDGPLAGRPSCATQSYYMIADEHSDAGKDQFAVLLSAYMSGRAVMIEGTGTCTRWSDGEDIMAITLK